MLGQAAISRHRPPAPLSCQQWRDHGNHIAAIPCPRGKRLLRNTWIGKTRKDSLTTYPCSVSLSCVYAPPYDLPGFNCFHYQMCCLTTMPSFCNSSEQGMSPLFWRMSETPNTNQNSCFSGLHHYHRRLNCWSHSLSGLICPIPSSPAQKCPSRLPQHHPATLSNALRCLVQTYLPWPAQCWNMGLAGQPTSLSQRGFLQVSTNMLYGHLWHWRTRAGGLCRQKSLSGLGCINSVKMWPEQEE